MKNVRRRDIAGLLVLMVLAAVRLFPTYSTFTATFDEPLHIADGMEWLDKGTYTYERQHPPLARIAVSLGPYLSGIRSQSFKDAAAEGNAILFSNDRYFHNLTLARLGNLPYLFLGCVVVFLWSWRWFGRYRTGQSGRDGSLLERDCRQRRQGKRLRLVQGSLGPLLADHSAHADRCDGRG